VTKPQWRGECGETKLSSSPPDSGHFACYPVPSQCPPERALYRGKEAEALCSRYLCDIRMANYLQSTLLKNKVLSGICRYTCADGIVSRKTGEEPSFVTVNSFRLFVFLSCFC
jgi:hypothetical protein